MIQIKFFAMLRERIGLATLNFEYAGEKTVAEIKQQLVSKGAQWQVLAEQEVLCAVNQTLCGPESKVNDGDEIAFFPPVTGG
ncbi:molybdopterin converting factor subunit 1 [Aliiglaciecola litoralis]|uniref:Molybdopterin synthase sulfur carrier subunit n=1 Tax=Aliiglaciecola litoralis TaxID=582857 RepID=A0ABN1LRX2_9ALTE